MLYSRTLLLCLTLLTLAACEERKTSDTKKSAEGVAAEVANASTCPDLGIPTQEVLVQQSTLKLLAPPEFKVVQSPGEARAEVILKRVLEGSRGALTMRLILYHEPASAADIAALTVPEDAARGPINADVGDSKLGKVYLTDRGIDAALRTFALSPDGAQQQKVELIVGAGAARACHAPLVALAQKMMLSLEHQPATP